MSLAYVSKLVQSLTSEKNVLLCMSRGLGLLKVIETYLCSLGEGVHILLNFTKHELCELETKLVVKDLSDCSPQTRVKNYRKGGLIYVTGRTITVDLLEQKLNPSEIKTLVVNSPEKLASAAHERFVLELMKQAQSSYCLKLFSERPELVQSRILEEFEIQKVLCGSRQDSWISEELSNLPGVWVKETVAICSRTQRINNMLLEMIKECISEIKRTLKVTCS